MLLYEICKSEHHKLHTNNSLSLVQTRISESGHFEVTGKFLLAKQCFNSVHPQDKLGGEISLFTLAQRA